MKKILISIFFIALSINIFAQDLKTSQLLGGIIKSDKWIIKKQGAEEHFKGNVSYETNDLFLSSDEAVYKKDIDTLILTKNVYIKSSVAEDKHSIVEIFCHKAIYNKSVGIVELYPRKRGNLVRLKHTDDDNNVWDGYAEKVVGDDNTKKMSLITNAYIEGENFKIRSDVIIYDDNKNTVETAGLKAYVEGTYKDMSFYFVSDKIKFNTEENIIYSDKNSKGLVEGLEVPEQKGI